MKRAFSLDGSSRKIKKHPPQWHTQCFARSLPRIHPFPFLHCCSSAHGSDDPLHNFVNRLTIHPKMPSLDIPKLSRHAKFKYVPSKNVGPIKRLWPTFTHNNYNKIISASSGFKHHNSLPGWSRCQCWNCRQDNHQTPPHRTNTSWCGRVYLRRRLLSRLTTEPRVTSTGNSDEEKGKVFSTSMKRSYIF